ncbi:alpha-L-fucosidase [Paraflavitalea speifideaquila]|uniref:alpha-L-fucosidase n=1 Tax=Paraflavitalea speifideaquila TaxID=3076558 RepID=UPI0028E7CF5A|nr:alpha-L-fucosidase [Paraflavitalea speifideiaquila]
MRQLSRTRNVFSYLLITTSLLLPVLTGAQATGKSKQDLASLQQAFVDLRFGMFIHFNIPTFMDQDWADPDASPILFNPAKLNCDQWAKAAKSANMSYGCLTTKHHSGFAIWDTKTTDYNVMNSPYKKDVVKEYVNAFRANGLKVMLYYSILDTHHKLRPGHITPQHIAMVKAQLTELLTNYGEISALVIDGWDAPWSRISYDDIPFEEVYLLVKSIQPNCLVMDLNAAKYPAEALYYTDIKSYEQGAGQHISKESNQLPALSCLPINDAWFWKTSFPTRPVKDVNSLVNDNIIPFNNAYCNFILNVAPNRDGLIDDNALAALKQIGQTWKHQGSTTKLPAADAPIISTNLAKFKRPMLVGVMICGSWTLLPMMILVNPGFPIPLLRIPGSKFCSKAKGHLIWWLLQNRGNPTFKNTGWSITRMVNGNSYLPEKNRSHKSTSV